MSGHALRLFALASGQAFGGAVARHLGIELSAHEEREFEDGEHKSRPLVSVRGCDTYVIQSLFGDDRQSTDDRLVRLLFFLATLKENGADRVTAVVPYLAFARKDRRTQPRDPVTMRYVAQLFEAVGIDRVVSLDVHNPAAYENAFRCACEHLEARGLLIAHFRHLLRGHDIVVVSPDSGGVKRAERFRAGLAQAIQAEPASAFVEKHRARGVVSGTAVVGDINGRAAIIVDDLISTGTTMVRAARACRQRGAIAVYVAATHGLFMPGADEALADPAIDAVVVTNTVPPFRLSAELAAAKLTVLDATSLIAEAVRRLHDDGSLVDLMEP